MKIKKESCTLVLLGHWNQHILSPGWSAKNIFDEPGLGVEIALDLGLPPRYTSEQSHVRMIPTEDNVTFVALQHDDECLQKIEDLAYKLVDKLSYTPVRAFGINFSFADEASKPDLLEIFKFSDNEPLNGFGCQLTFSAIRRRLIIENRMVNLTISNTNKGDKISFDFNFHYGVSGTSEVISKIKGSVIENKKIAENLLKNVYKLDYDNLEVKG
jgi:hypothetical protein